MKIKNKAILRNILMLIVVFLIAGVMDGFILSADVQAGKICDPTLKYCLEQKCQVPFRMVSGGVLKAYSFFEKFGYTGKYQVDIEYTPKVSVVWGEGAEKTKIRVLGKYVEDDRKIYLTCWCDKWLSEENAFKLDMSIGFYETVLTHEMIHFLTNRYSKSRVNSILSEYIAFSGQLELISQEKIKRLVRDNNIKHFDENDISELAYSMGGPGIFGLKSYLHYKQTNGLLVKKILDGSFKMPIDIWLLN
jgi:hypothetical protein